jgi:hypothetical protein
VEFVKEALAPDVRLRLRTLVEGGDVTITLSGRAAYLRWTTGPLLGSLVERRAVELLTEGLKIAEALSGLGPAEGVEIVEAKTEVEETECQICGTALTGDVVACVRCKTLHHKDCWDFNGVCSTYGCGSRSARKAEWKDG